MAQIKQCLRMSFEYELDKISLPYPLFRSQCFELRTLTGRSLERIERRTIFLFWTVTLYHVLRYLIITKKAIFIYYECHIFKFKVSSHNPLYISRGRVKDSTDGYLSTQDYLFQSSIRDSVRSDIGRVGPIYYEPISLQETYFRDVQGDGFLDRRGVRGRGGDELLWKLSQSINRVSSERNPSKRLYRGIWTSSGRILRVTQEVPKLSKKLKYRERETTKSYRTLVPS